MKKIFILSTSIVLLTFLLFGTTSCSKYNNQPAKLVIGEYIGSGIDSTGTPYHNEIMRISRVSDRRVKVEPAGLTKIKAFEVNLIQLDHESVIGTTDTDLALAAEIEDGSVSLAFTTVQEETFAGTKQ